MAIGGCDCLVFGGVERQCRVGNKQLNNQLDCWWKAKGGVDKRPVTVRNSDQLQPPLAFGDDVWKVEENGRSIVCRHHDCHRRGGARGGGGAYPERTEEREGENDKTVADERQRQCPSSTTTAMMKSPSGVRVDLHRSVGAVRANRLCHLGGAVAGRSLLRRLHRQASSIAVGGGKALGLSAGIAIVALDWARVLLDERFGVHVDPRHSGNDDNNGDDGNEDDYDYTMGDLSSLAASFGDGEGADAQIPADISWQFRTECV